METIPITPPRTKYLPVIWARLTRRRFKAGTPAPCHPHTERLVADEGKAWCYDDGRAFPLAV